MADRPGPDPADPAGAAGAARAGTVARASVDGPRRAALEAGFVLLLALAAAASAQTAPGLERVAAAADVHACADARIAVRGGDAADREDVCAGGQAAIAFLEPFGRVVPPRIDVQVVDRMPPPYDPGAAAVYDRGRDTILLLDQAGFERFGRWLGRPIDRAMHRAIAGHEVAHAVSSGNFAMRSPSTLAREYVALVAMFAIMDPVFRERALERYPDPPWEAGLDPDEAESLEDPMRFAARAWRHWLGAPDRGAYLRDVLEGRALGRPAPPGG